MMYFLINFFKLIKIAFNIKTYYKGHLNAFEILMD